MTSESSPVPAWVSSAYADPWARVGMAIRLYLIPAVIVLVGIMWGSSTLQGHQEPVRWRGEVDLSIGKIEGERPYLFDDVRAVAMDLFGRIYVADSGADEIRVFSDAGEYLFRLGGRGSGPGEFQHSMMVLCSLRFWPRRCTVGEYWKLA